MNERLSDEEITTLARGYVWREENVRRYIQEAEALGVPIRLIISTLDGAASSGVLAPSPFELARAAGIV